MKNLENMKALDEIEMAKVAGGYDDDHTIFDTFVEWLIQLPTNYPEDDPSDDDQPLPFPQDRRGNKAPFEAPHNFRIFV